MLKTLLLMSLSMILIATEAGWQQLLVAGYKLDRIEIMDRSGATVWSMDHKARVCDAWMLDDGRIVFSGSRDGTFIVQPDYAAGEGGEVVWHRPVPEGCETHSCQPLGGDRFLIGESYDGVSHILELGTDGTEYHRVTLEGLGSRHKTFRVIRKTPQGTYLIAGQEEGYTGRRAMEVDADGDILRRFPGGGHFSVRLANGNTLLSSGDGHVGEAVAKVFEVDPAGEVVWQLSEDDLPDGITLGYTGALQRLPNGNTLICNAKFHMGKDGDPGPAVFEVTPDKQVVWQAPERLDNFVTTAMVIDRQNPAEGAARASGYDKPESVCPHPNGRDFFVSNIQTSDGGFWADDNAGYISLIDNDGTIIKERWLTDGLNAPKGLCVHGDHLYIADNARLLRVPLVGERRVEVVPVPGLQRANDLLSDGTRVWVSDTAAGTIQAYDPATGTVQAIVSPPGPNGLWMVGERFFAVSASAHEVYEIDATGAQQPRALGLAAHFATLDGIQSLPDGSLLVSDWKTGRISRISPDLDAVTIFLELASPADFWIDGDRLLIPQVLDDSVRIVRP